MTEFLQRRQARIRDQIKETLEEAKKQRQLQEQPPIIYPEELYEDQNGSQSQITIESSATDEIINSSTILDDQEDEITVLD